MIPKNLTIKGLYSYQAEQTINFTELTKDNLFGIFGNVGAGKSSILEAIMYALYGEVERMGSKGRNYNMMNLSSNDLLIIFDFKIEGKLYRSKISGKRNSKKFADVKIDGPNFYEFLEDEFKPLSIKSAETLIGLKATDFKKTIIIPQGTFQDFLQLGDADRTDMMSKLFSLERYDLDPNAKILQIENNTISESLKGRLAQNGEVELEDIENKKTELIDLQKDIEAKQIELGSKRLIENGMNQLKADFELLQNMQKIYTDLNAKESDFLKLEKQIDDYETVVLTFANLLENHKKGAKEVLQNKQNLNSKQQQFAANDTFLQEFLKTLEKQTPQYEQREMLKKQAIEARKIIEIKKNEEEIKRLDCSLQKGNVFLENKNITLQKLKSEIIENENQRKNLSDNQTNWQTLNAIKDWFTSRFALEKEITRLENDYKIKDEKLATIYQNKSFIIANDLPIFNIQLAKETRISDVIIRVKSKIAALNATYEKIQQEKQHLKTIEKMEQYATELTEGEECPLCGATHHPGVMPISDIRSTLKNIETQLTQIKKDIKSLENIDQQLFTLNASFNNEIEDRQKLHVLIVDEKEKLNKHFQNFLWSPFSPSDFGAIEKAMQTALEIENTKKKLENDARLIQKNKESAENDIEKYRKGINDYQLQKTAKESALQVLKDQIEVLEFDNMVAKSELELTQWAENLEKQYITIESEFKSLENKIQKCKSDGQLLKGSIEELEQRQKELEAKEIEVLSELTAKLNATHFGDIATLKDILATKLDIPKERKKLAAFKEQKLLAFSRLSELNEKLKEKQYDSDGHKALIIEIKAMDSGIQSKSQRVGELKSEITDKENRLKLRELLEKQIAESQIRAENIKILRGLFQGKGFVNYASSVYLQSIINAANERFMRLTRQQLRLEITDTNNFIIRDMLNDGKLRDVRTLSGGQTFQAALSLALALSDHIQSKNAARQNFFFLDEGFGSLDKESLHIVFETLKALRKENRIVGIISHVEDMRLEIERYLEVSLSESTGSQVNLVIG